MKVFLMQFSPFPLLSHYEVQKSQISVINRNECPDKRRHGSCLSMQLAGCPSRYFCV